MKIAYYKLLNLREVIKFYIFKNKNKDLYKILLANKKYKNKHSGERCFILGNGPSLKSQDLSSLSDEYVFTVNQIMRHPDFEKIKTNYHFWADPMFFKIDVNKEEDLELLEVMKQVNTTGNKPECFFPISQQSFINKFKLDEQLNTNFYRSKYIIHDNYNKDFDFTENIPGFGTVVHWAIIMAIYMGFKEIYLMGCDNTGIIVTINSILKNNTDSDYVYKVTDNEKRRMENLLKENTLENYCKAYTKTLADYRKLFNYCKKRNIKLINCSANTVIDTIPKKDFESIIAKDIR